jgi:hypothetical protein
MNACKDGSIMDATIADKNQINGEVKERNRFYRALIQIQAIAADATEMDNADLNSNIKKIVGICNESLKQKINRRNEPCF